MGLQQHAPMQTCLVAIALPAGPSIPQDIECLSTLRIEYYRILRLWNHAVQQDRCSSQLILADGMDCPIEEAPAAIRALPGPRQTALLELQRTLTHAQRPGPAAACQTPGEQACWRVQGRRRTCTALGTCHGPATYQACRSARRSRGQYSDKPAQRSAAAGALPGPRRADPRV